LIECHFDREADAADGPQDHTIKRFFWHISRSGGIIERREGSFYLAEQKMRFVKMKVDRRGRAGVAPAQSLIESLEGRMLLTSTPFFPSQIETAYGFNQITFDNGMVAGNGMGQTIAIIGVDNDLTVNSDLTAFDAALKIPDPTLTVVGQDGGAVPSNPTQGLGTYETALDVEWAHAIAPAANILLVEANSTGNTDLLAATKYAAGVSGVSVVTSSYVGPESPSETSDDADYRTPATHNGVTFVAASGDDSSVTYPATSHNVVGVGGTSLTLANSTGTYGSESAWSGSGGGVSTLEPEPAFQLVAQSTGFRTAPDVAFYADPNDGGYAIVEDGNMVGAAGTSGAAPCWAALFAIADQGRALNGLGTLDGRTQTLPMLYALYDTPLYASAFHDITTGTNGAGISATVGYDEVTGLGSPQANVLVQYLAGNISVPEPAAALAVTLLGILMLARPARRPAAAPIFSDEAILE
jgi:subtilase family serine protease